MLKRCFSVGVAFWMIVIFIPLYQNSYAHPADPCLLRQEWAASGIRSYLFGDFAESVRRIERSFDFNLHCQRPLQTEFEELINDVFERSRERMEKQAFLAHRPPYGNDGLFLPAPRIRFHTNPMIASRLFEPGRCPLWYDKEKTVITMDLNDE